MLPQVSGFGARFGLTREFPWVERLFYCFKIPLLCMCRLAGKYIHGLFDSRDSSVRVTGETLIRDEK